MIAYINNPKYPILEVKKIHLGKSVEFKCKLIVEVHWNLVKYELKFSDKYEFMATMISIKVYWIHFSCYNSLILYCQLLYKNRQLY